MKRKLVFLSLYVFACALVSFAVLEFAARQMHANATFKERMDSSIRWQPSGFIVCCPTAGQNVYDYGDERIDYTKVRYAFNSLGYRGSEFAVEKEPGEVRIAILGGSHVFDLQSYDCEGNPGFSQLIQDRFRRSGKKVTVINAGMPGSDTRRFPALFILDLHRYHPDIIIVSSAWNDIKWITTMKTDTLLQITSPQASQKNPMIERVSLLDTFLGNSCAYRKLRDLVWRRRLGINSRFDAAEGLSARAQSASADMKYDPERGWNQYRVNLEAVVDLAIGQGAKPILAIEERLPSPAGTKDEERLINYSCQPRLRSHADLVDAFARCDAVIRSVGDQRSVPILDVNHLMNGNANYFVDHIHTSVAGSRFIADHYYEFLVPYVDRATSGAKEK